MMHLYLPCVLTILMCIESLLIQVAVELLHFPAFRQMRVPLSHLSSVDRVLSRLNGATTLIVGDIALSVKAGLVTQQVLFSVVEDLGPYNVIVSQTWLHTMKAVPSTYLNLLGISPHLGRLTCRVAN